VKKNGKYIVNGQKIFITGAHVAHYLVAVVKTGDDKNKKTANLSVLLIDTKSPGLEIRRLNKLGVKATGTNEIFFTDVEVPIENLMGDEGKGWYQIVHTLNNERVTLAALSVGIGQAAFEYALKYARERIAFNKPIGQFQTIQGYLAEMITELEMARLLVYKAAWLQSQGKKCAQETAMAKLAASEAGFKATLQGMRIMGGYGYMMEYDMQRYFRDAVLFLEAPVSNEMIKNFICMELGLPRSY
jgi:alkylation response protein AidB-like acyl-CoA dehydrogenase